MSSLAQTKIESKPKNDHVLIVDDTLKNIQLLGAILREHNYQISVAQNGKQALELVAMEVPDLILLDISMPEMDGFETCAHLKKNPATRDIPVIFLTAKTEIENIVEGFELGAVDYVTKPFNASELLSRVNTHLQLKNAREQLAKLACKLSKYLSPQVYDSIFSGEKDVKIESYRRYLTVFFSDIVGFTPKTEELDHLALTKWLNTYLNEMAGIALDYGGTLDKFIGDSVMVFFGDPTTCGKQEDAVRCVEMALAMQKKAKELGIEVRMGISSGDCTVGNFGSEDRMEYTVIGRQVNVASRLEHHSEAGKILISDATYAHVKNAILCEPQGEIRVKGIDYPIMTHRVDHADQQMDGRFPLRRRNSSRFETVILDLQKNQTLMAT